MASTFKNAIKYILLFLLGIAVLYFAFKGQDLKKIWLEIKTANIFWIFTSVLAVWIAHVFRALRWQMLYQSIHYQVGFWNTYHAVMVGYLANLVLPRFGEVGRCSIMYKTDKVPIFASIGTVITERLFDILVLLLTTVAMLIFQYNRVAAFIHNTFYAFAREKIFSASFFWLIPIALFLSIILIIRFIFRRKKIGKRVLRTFVSLRQGFSSFTHLDRKNIFLLYTALIWLFYLLSMYFAFLAIPPTAHLGWSAAFTSLVFSGFAMAAPVQGGIGVFHWIVARGLSLYHLPFNEGLAYATMIHSSQVLLILVLGSLSLFISLNRQSKSSITL